MLILVGPSASGKTQVTSKLIKDFKLVKLVTHTSRSMRVGEVDGIDYIFLKKEEFEKRINDNYFLEYVTYNGNYYGTSYSDIASNKVVILEPNGLKTYISKLRDKVKIIYFDAPSDVLKERMLSRGDSFENVLKRLELDKTVFNDDVKKLCDLVIDTSKYDLDSMAKICYDFYKPYMRD